MYLIDFLADSEGSIHRTAFRFLLLLLLLLPSTTTTTCYYCYNYWYHYTYIIIIILIITIMSDHRAVNCRSSLKIWSSNLSWWHIFLLVIGTLKPNLRKHLIKTLGIQKFICNVATKVQIKNAQKFKWQTAQRSKFNAMAPWAQMMFPWNIFQVKYKTSTFIGFWFTFYFFWLLYVCHEHMEASQSFWILQYGFESVITEGRQANPTEV